MYCNPPWKNVLPFIEQAPSARSAVFLVPARTNARWFHRALELGAKAEFFPGRVRFIDGEEPEGKTKGSPVDCVLLLFGEARTASVVALEAYGASRGLQQVTEAPPPGGNAVTKGVPVVCPVCKTQCFRTDDLGQRWCPGCQLWWTPGSHALDVYGVTA